jgi:hypothetical protein
MVSNRCDTRAFAEMNKKATRSPSYADLFVRKVWSRCSKDTSEADQFRCIEKYI